MTKNPYSVVTPYIESLAALSCCANGIKPEMYAEHNVKRGLRDLQGRGVLTGLTEISEVISHKIIDGVDTNIPGELCYRGVNIKDFTNGLMAENRYGFEECVYLLLFGALPTQDELSEFCALLSRYRSLPTSFPRDVIMKAPSKDMMNTLARSVLTLYSYDDNPDDISIPNVLRQCLQLIAIFPMLAVYGYHSFKYYHEGQSLYIHPPEG